jgi:hypothetical protein
MASCHTHAACYGIFSHGIRRIHRTSCRGGLPRISQICTDVRVRCSPTEFTEFTEPPTEMSSHGFHRFTQILRVRCSPTEYAEFTEPPTEMSSHGFHRFTQILRVRCSPTEYAEFTEPPAEMSSHGFHRFTQILRVRCSPTEFGSVGMAGMPYPPTSVNIRAICGRLFSARSFCAFRAFCGNIFSPTDFTDLHRCLECAVLQQNTEFGSVGMAGMPYPPTSVLICVICGRLFSARSFCAFRAFCGSPFSARSSVYSVYSVGASSPLVRLVQLRLLHPLAESTEVVCKSHPFTSNPAFCMSSQYCGYDFVTTCGSLMRSPGNTIAAGANAIAMRWSS